MLNKGLSALIFGPWCSVGVLLTVNTYQDTQGLPWCASVREALGALKTPRLVRRGARTPVRVGTRVLYPAPVRRMALEPHVQELTLF